MLSGLGSLGAGARAQARGALPQLVGEAVEPAPPIAPAVEAVVEKEAGPDAPGDAPPQEVIELSDTEGPAKKTPKDGRGLAASSQSEVQAQPPGTRSFKRPRGRKSDSAGSL